ncbi:acyl-homoserine-lactone synthase [Pseudomonas sp. KNUC1026]|uniref:acyl-homoserine-lactone synthase n=1 Tax=Pseudomonas sp. KNUC1026 TaxID=2893890 RepID=UPI001F41DC4A|nr:acyl-homoserine-lactone synthase [Pseudomonas sp. KNUC1026]UFH50193.1 GNAT family N-acetyltransferase [Pseudomonas sp. KNUC1026]
MDVDVMEYITAAWHQLSETLRQKMASYRHAVFIERLGWSLETPAGHEIDQFDRDNTVYVIATDDQEHIVGVARLLKTTEPYLLSEVFPHLTGGNPLPRRADTWELSRFAFTASAAIQRGRYGTEELLDHCLSYARSMGARKLLTVSPPGIEKLLRRSRYGVRRLGPTTLCEGEPISAFEIDIPTVALKEA